MSSCCSSAVINIASKLRITDKLSYSFEINGNSEINSQKVKNATFKHEMYSDVYYKWIKINSYFVMKSIKKNHIAIIHIINTMKDKNSNILLFSHGNASDLGTMYPILIDMSTQLKVDIIAYDYSGYGESEGKPSESVIYEDIELVTDFMKNNLNIDFTKVIVFGNSLGSATSIHLCASGKHNDIKALILLSPIVSGLKTFDKNLNISNEDLNLIDFFSNISKIKEIYCPIFVIHGTKDEIIPYDQVVNMSKSIKRVYEWYPKMGDHNNILCRYRKDFYIKCKTFFEYLDTFKKRKDYHENDQQFTLFINNIQIPDDDDDYKKNINFFLASDKENNGLVYKIDNNSLNLIPKQTDEYESMRSSCVNINNISQIEIEYKCFQKSNNT